MFLTRFVFRVADLSMCLSRTDRTARERPGNPVPWNKIRNVNDDVSKNLKKRSIQIQDYDSRIQSQQWSTLKIFNPFKDLN